MHALFVRRINRRRRFTIVTVLITTAVWSQPNAVAAGPKPVAHTVSIEAVRFTPETLEVPKGDVIAWVNKDPFPHTVTARDGTFDSRRIAAGRSWKYVARKEGRYPYFCTLHSTMQGVLIVK